MQKKNNLPLITVVVPIYKTEKYLRECVDSILNQSYKNLEILLIDDGSPDQCGEICDNYQKADSRIKVIHQKNQGLSGARNAAIDIAKGKYITFVDSDDWISDNMIESLYEYMQNKKVQMTVCSFESFFEDGTAISSNLETCVYIYSKEKALDCFLFNDYLTPCVCGKLYAIDLWKNVRCPEGKLFEDQFTTYKLIDLCEKIVFTTMPMYHYRKHSDSIGHSTFNKKTYHLYDAIHEEYEYIIKKYKDACPNITVARITWEIVFINMMIIADHHDKNIIKKIQVFAKANISKVWKCKYISKIRKGQISLFAFCYPVYVKFYQRYKKKHPLA